MKESIFYYTKRGHLHELAKVETNFDTVYEFGVQNHYLKLINTSRPYIKAKPSDFGSRFFILPRDKEALLQENYDRILSLGYLVMFKDKELSLIGPQKEIIPINEKTNWLQLFTDKFKLDQSKDNPSVVEGIMEEMKQNKKDEEEEKEIITKYGTLLTLDDALDIKKISLPEETMDSFSSFINQYKIKDFLKEVGVNKTQSVLNFWGPPGTGKTLSAQALAKSIGKPLLKVKYEQVESKYIGETEKNLKKMFEEAKAAGAVLFLDEADSLLSKRMDSPSSSTENYLNLARNVFMQQLDNFNGIVILTTNIYKAYDPAITSRISKNIKFDLPDQKSRLKILKLHIKQNVKIENKVKTLNEVAKITEGFSGRDLKNLIEESLTKAATDSYQKDKLKSFKVMKDHFLKEVNKIKKSKEDSTFKQISVSL